jgi:hypothetical protein
MDNTSENLQAGDVPAGRKKKKKKKKLKNILGFDEWDDWHPNESII